MLRGRGAFCFGEKRAATAEMLFEDAADIAVYSRSFGGASHHDGRAYGFHHKLKLRSLQKLAERLKKRI